LLQQVADIQRDARGEADVDPKDFVTSGNCVIKCGKNQYLKSAPDGPWAAEWTFSPREALVVPYADGQAFLDSIKASDPDHPLAKTARLENVTESVEDRKQRKWDGRTKQTDELAKTDPLAATAMAGGGTLIRAALPSREKWNAMLAAHAPGCGSPTPYPGTSSTVPCGSNVAGVQFLCPHCEPVQEAGEVDPKQFIEDQNYLVRTGIGAMTRYLQRRDGQAFWIDDPDEATAMTHADAVGTVDALQKMTTYADLRVEMTDGDREVWNFVESEDAKEFVQAKMPPAHAMKPEGAGYVCSCGQWKSGTVTGWSSAIPAAIKAFKKHVRDARKKERANESEEIDPKQYVDDTPYRCVIRKNRPRGRLEDREDRNFFWDAGSATWTKHIQSASTFPNRAGAERALEIMREKFPNGKTTFDGAVVEPVSVYESHPFEDDGLPGEVSSFLRKVRSKRKKVTAKPIL
jgi:hypothetical protein